ncbi:MAG: winged helix-turn-helix transcriptional regulator [Thermoprotei archaeon]|nr:winged helix-turn-helix transcriptional regulator [Thermoprotei archaeon]
MSGESLDSTDVDILDLLESEGPMTISSIAFKIGRAKSMVWRRVSTLESLGLIRAKKVGGVTIVYRVYEKTAPGVVTLGILKASEYPYIIDFARRLRGFFSEVKVRVYDEAFKLALDLSTNKVQIAMAPVPTLMLAHRISSGRVQIIGGGSGGGAFILESKRGGSGHATTMASTMEMCSEKFKLEPPRVYKGGGGDILGSVLKGEVRHGVVWEPYAFMGRARGLEAHPCDVSVCCLLGANKSVGGKFRAVSNSLKESIEDSRKGLESVDAYSSLLNLPRELVKETVKSYEFHAELPLDIVRSYWAYVKASVIPDVSLGEAVYF